MQRSNYEGENQPRDRQTPHQAVVPDQTPHHPVNDYDDEFFCQLAETILGPDYGPVG